MQITNVGYKQFKSDKISVSVRSSRYEARGKFGGHERCVRVARGVAESTSSFLCANINNIIILVCHSLTAMLQSG